MLARVHRDGLQKLLGSDLRYEALVDRRQTIARMRGYIDGATQLGIAATISALDAHSADTLWLDGSNLGRIAKAVRRVRPRIRIITFCHNVEARFFLGALRRAPTPRALGVLIANFVAEGMAVRNSHDLVALSNRDSAGLRRLYGRCASVILPMALRDQLTEEPSSAQLMSADAPLLFVGGAFYANQAGIAWFARRVAPLINLSTKVVGQGMEGGRAELEAARGVTVVGAVDRVEPYYHEARAAIAPIFDGSGMKTKVAEALMFGKRVIGTREAFSGYEEIADQAGWICETAKEFAAAVSALESMPVVAFDPALRALYERDYSALAVERRLTDWLGLTAAGATTQA